ncbi:MAG: FAD-binding oxidoreductase [Candidatus Nanopelagicales bacterium]
MSSVVARPFDRLPGRLIAALDARGVPVVEDPAILAGHAVDWTGHWCGPVLGMVRPRSTEQVAGVLSAARSFGIPVQVQGGNTGLVGGSVPDRPSLLLSTLALDRMHPVDRVERTVAVGAGVTAARLSGHAMAAGLRFGVDLAARDSATIGGMVATNAGGLAVCAHGMMRDQVRGVVAVLADGRIVRTVGRPRKDNTGYDLTGLLVGSEGTLGVVTEIEVALHQAPAAPTVALLARSDLAGAVVAARTVQASGWPVLAAEVVDAAGVSQVARALGVPDPMAGRGRARWLLLLEVADAGTAEGLTPVADDVLAVATAAPDRARLWAYRERQTEVYARLEGLRKLDIAVRLDRLDEAVAAIRGAVGSRQRVGFFGHALDGNLHVQVMLEDPPAGCRRGVGQAPGQAPDADRTVERILEAVVSLGGSISAEHGIGRLKAPHLQLARSAGEISWMRAIRASVDPEGLLNPGVLLS